MGRKGGAAKRREEDPTATRVRRRALALVADAERLLDVGDGPLDAQAIHALRVLCKRLRAVWQLLTPICGRAVTRAPERVLRDAARALAGRREAHVARRTLERLARRHARDDEERAALARLEDLVAERWPAVTAEPALAAPLRVAFAAQRTALEDLPPQFTDAELGAGLLRSYARAREQGRRAALLREAAAWHRCRRWAKYELYQLELVAGAHPEQRRIEGLGRLGETLGRFNDVCTLRELADDGRARLLQAGAAVSVLRILAREERALRARMERRFAKLYRCSEEARRRRIRRVLKRGRR